MQKARFALLLRLCYKAAQEGRLNKSVMAKIFTDGGGILNFTLNDKITFDAAAKTPAESVLNNALEGACKIQD